jgi:hypothetical protein
MAEGRIAGVTPVLAPSLSETLLLEAELESFNLQQLPFKSEQFSLDVLLLQFEPLLPPLEAQLPQFQLLSLHLQAAILLLLLQFPSFLLQFPNLLFQLHTLALQQLPLGGWPDLLLLVPGQGVVRHPDQQKQTNQTCYKTSGETLHTSLLTDGWRI